MDAFLSDILFECRRYKDLADQALARVKDPEFFRRPGDLVNPIALVVKHLAGNLRSRWTDLLTSDGEKPDRDRDQEFILTERDSRANLMAAWEQGWQALFETGKSLKAADLDRVVTIRGEEHTVRQALLRGMSHIAYHTGQILYLARLVEPEGTWLTIAPGQSCGRPGDYRKAERSP